MTGTTVNLEGVARTLLVPLACRAIESARPDAILRDPRAVEVYRALGGGRELLLGMGGHDLFAAVMRVRKFDAIARGFLSRNPGGRVVDIGCGLDTRFDRLDDGQMNWLGLDLPQVIELRRRLLPDGARCRTLARSMFDLSWLDSVAPSGLPVIFLAEGVFPYFKSEEIKPLVEALVARFPHGELVFDSLAPWMAWFHNATSSVLKQSDTQVRWETKDPAELQDWGLQMLERWSYFNKNQPRLGAANLIRFIPPLARASYIVHYRLGT
jgi:O-methyltransferase involved in polyketide biosynthesis